MKKHMKKLKSRMEKNDASKAFLQPSQIVAHRFQDPLGCSKHLLGLLKPFPSTVGMK